MDDQRYSFNFIKKAMEPDPEFKEKLEEQKRQDTLARIEEAGLV